MPVTDIGSSACDRYRVLVPVTDIGFSACDRYRV